MIREHFGRLRVKVSALNDQGIVGETFGQLLLDMIDAVEDAHHKINSSKPCSCRTTQPHPAPLVPPSKTWEPEFTCGPKPSIVCEDFNAPHDPAKFSSPEQHL